MITLASSKSWIIALTKSLYILILYCSSFVIHLSFVYCSFIFANTIALMTDLGLTRGVEIFFYKKTCIKVAISKNNRKFAFYKISIKQTSKTHIKQ